MQSQLNSSDKPRAYVSTVLEIADILFRQRGVVLITFAFVFLAVMAYGLCLPSYRAEMKFLVRKGRIDPPVAAQATPSEFPRYDITEEEINSEAQLLRDWDVLRPVVVSTGLDKKGASWIRLGDDANARTARAVRRLAGQLQVTPIRKSQLISVEYESGDPQVAAHVLRELSSAYLQKHLVAHRPAGESVFFQQQADEYRKALNSAEGRLLGVVEERAIVSPELERDLILQKLNDADASYRQVAVEISAADERMRALKQHLASLPDRRTTEIRSADNPELLQQLKSTLLTLELKRLQLLSKYQPGYRLVDDIEKQIAQTKESIAAEALAPVRQETTANEPRYEWASNELEKTEVEAQALHAREHAAGVLVASYRRSAQRLAEAAIEHNDLVRNAKVAEENYLLYLRKREEARVGDALDQQGIVNVAIVEEPFVPALPRWSAPTVTALAFLLSLVVSTVAGFVADYLEPGYRTPEQLMSSLGVPTLASLPREAA